jgi:GntR family transcriptional regulator
VPEALCPSLYEDIQQNYQSLNALLNSYGLQMVRGIERISTSLADALQADLLGVRVGEPLLYIERITFDESGIPVEFIKTYNCPDRYNCTIVLVR